MTEFVLENKQGNEAQHGHTSVESFGVGVKPIPRQLALRDQGGLKHGRDPEKYKVWSGRGHSRER